MQDIGQRALVLALLALAWEGYGHWVGNDLVFPTLADTLAALARVTASGELPAGILRLAARAGPFLRHRPRAGGPAGRPRLSTLTAMFKPASRHRAAAARAALVRPRHAQPRLRGGALRALGGGAERPCAGALHPSHLAKGGGNLGLRGLRLAAFIFAPAALPAIISGLRIGWAFAWRALIAAALVFGATSRSGGVGWFIAEHRNNLEIPEVFASLLVVFAIGLLVEGVVFRTLEARTVRRWGLQRQ